MKLLKRIAAFFLLSFAGCGYVFQGGGSVLPVDVKNIYVPLAENDTADSGLSQLLTEALRDRFERYGVLVVVDKIEQADAVLNSRILSVSREARSVSSGTDTALQVESVFIISAELQRVSGPMLWKNNGLKVSRAFGTTSDSVVTSSADFSFGSSLSGADLANLDSREISRGQQQAVFEAMAEDAARIIYNDAVAPEF